MMPGSQYHNTTHIVARLRLPHFDVLGRQRLDLAMVVDDARPRRARADIDANVVFLGLVNQISRTAEGREAADLADTDFGDSAIRVVHTLAAAPVAPWTTSPVREDLRHVMSLLSLCPRIDNLDRNVSLMSVVKQC